MATEEAYDYIIVGGGTAGLVLASRLSEDADKSVLVIEAGANRKGDVRIDTPGMMTSLYDDPDYDWAFMTEPQASLNGRRIAYPRGRVLGGSSAINFSAILYPSQADFNDWAELGNSGWDAESMVPYLRKFHTYHPASDAVKKQLSLDKYMDEKLQGTSGPLQLTIPEVYSDFNVAWDKTFQELGFHSTGDPIAGKALGAFTNPLSIHPTTKRREYSASSYFTDEVASRPNLHLITEATVDKIHLETAPDGTVTATGVRITTAHSSHQTIRTTAGGEVLLAAGTIKSPQLLELSGIGNPTLLSAHAIATAVDLPGVGENLQDHVLSSISYEIADAQVSGDSMRDPALLHAALQQYQESRSGPMSGTPLSFSYLPATCASGALSPAEIAALLDAQSDDDDDCTPAAQGQAAAAARQHALLRARLADPAQSAVEYMMLPVQLNTNVTSATTTTMQELFGMSTPGNHITILAMLNHPLSRGSVHIASADPGAAPRIDPRYLSHPLDVELLARGTQFIERVARTAPLAGLLKEGGGRRIPEGGDLLGEGGLDEAREVARERAWTAFHPSGTCAMMPREVGGVVDGRLRVHGVRGLRVVDASVFPMETLGNIQATVYAVAEKAADLVREDGRRRV
ncbi:hypothetical protein SLS55_004441 [Diplodia seriata]|uniref:Glucose-methanol-choline oxidoreductase N-terminal domain-containing protein n=1 Tax=Diplodia seriata TaxID=420778 RepID=A0ABR3CM34_9PEZI